VRTIILACGWNPETMTVGRMDELDPRLVCLKCSHGYKCDGERRVRVFSWRKMVRSELACMFIQFLIKSRTEVHHSMTTHWGDSRVKYEKISDTDAEVSRTLELKAESLQPQKEPAAWRCLLCLDGSGERDRMTKSRLQGHLNY